MSFWRTLAKRRWDAIRLCETWETEDGRKRMGGAGSSRNKRGVGILLHTRWKGKHLKTEQVGLLLISHNFFTTTYILQVTTYNFFNFLFFSLFSPFSFSSTVFCLFSPFSPFSPFSLFFFFSFFHFFSFYSLFCSFFVFLFVFYLFLGLPKIRFSLIFPYLNNNFLAWPDDGLFTQTLD